MVARVFDTNGDGSVRAGDDPSLIFVSGNTVNPLTRRGERCQSPLTTPSACHTGTLRVINARTLWEQCSLERASLSSAGFAGTAPAILRPNGGGGTRIAVVTAGGYVVALGVSASVRPELSVLFVSDQPIPNSGSALFRPRRGTVRHRERLGRASGACLRAHGIQRGHGGNRARGHRQREYGSPIVPCGALSVFVDLGGSGSDERLAGNTAYRSDGSVL